MVISTHLSHLVQSGQLAEHTILRVNAWQYNITDDNIHIVSIGVVDVLEDGGDVIGDPTESAILAVLDGARRGSAGGDEDGLAYFGADDDEWDYDEGDEGSPPLTWSCEWRSCLLRSRICCASDRGDGTHPRGVVDAPAPPTRRRRRGGTGGRPVRFQRLDHPGDAAPPSAAARPRGGRPGRRRRRRRRAPPEEGGEATGRRRGQGGGDDGPSREDELLRPQGHPERGVRASVSPRARPAPPRRPLRASLRRDTTVPQGGGQRKKGMSDSARNSILYCICNVLQYCNRSRPLTIAMQQSSAFLSHNIVSLADSLFGRSSHSKLPTDKESPPSR